jgi:hypothetical protein
VNNTVSPRKEKRQSRADHWSLRLTSMQAEIDATKIHKLIYQNKKRHTNQESKSHCGGISSPPPTGKFGVFCYFYFSFGPLHLFFSILSQFSGLPPAPKVERGASYELIFS